MRLKKKKKKKNKKRIFRRSDGEITALHNIFFSFFFVCEKKFRSVVAFCDEQLYGKFY